MLEVGQNYKISKRNKKEKEDSIVEALRHFRMPK